MRHLPSFTSVAALVALTVSTAEGQVQHEGWSAHPLTTVVLNPPGAREAGLGAAGSLLVTGPAAAWWNPARLARAGSGVTAHSYALYPYHHSGHSRHQFLAASWATGWKGLGVGVAANRILYPEMIRTDELGHMVGRDRPANTDLTVAAGLPLGRDWRAGAGLRWLQEDWGIFDFKGTAWALNAGLAWRKPGRWPVAAGVKLDNLGTVVHFEPSFNFSLPATATMALALDGLELADGRLSVAGEAVKLLSYENSSVPANVFTSWFRHGVRAELHEADYRLGAEYERAFTLPKLGELRLALRGGRRVLPARELRNWTWGLGLGWHGVQVEYSQEHETPRGAWLARDVTRRFSLGLSFSSDRAEAGD